MQFIQSPETFSLFSNSYKSQFNGFGGTSTAEYAVVRSQIPSQFYGGTRFQTFQLEWVPGYRGKGSLAWGQGGEQLWSINDDAFAPNAGTGIGKRPISSEPSYLIFNVRSRRSAAELMRRSSQRARRFTRSISTL